ncbi:MAG TPA: creatininase family protein [Armatimonadetes bacterium]|nr:creatininase family protein [Armatimonadota bacterium]
MRKVRYEEMRPHEVVEARTQTPIAYLPIGGIEWHGEHNCLGLDTVKAHALAIRCAEEGGGLVFPPLFYGENRERGLMEFNHDPNGQIAAKMGLPRENFAPGYMHCPPDEQDRRYIELLVHILHELESLGFKVIIIFAGHYPLLHHARTAIEWYSITSKARAWAVTGYELVRDIIPDAGDHAAKWETSLMMALRPELVDMSRLPEDPQEKLIGVGGIDPRGTASREYGERGVRAIVERVVAKAHELLAEAD